MKALTPQSPRLRFSGFYEPWGLKPINQLLSLVDRPIKMEDNARYSLITVKRGNRGVVSRGQYEGRKVLVKAQFKVSAGDFVISKRQIVHQACGIVPAKLDGSIVSNEYDVFRPTDECCIRFFDYFCYRQQMRHALFLSCVGVHLEKMLFKTNDWLKRKFPVPSFPEQRKIANSLTAVDGRIQQLSQKKALLEDYKKGVMQQLFSQALRFKDDHGNQFPDWEEKKFADIFVFSTGKNIKQEEASPDFATPCIRYGELYHMYNEVITTIINRTNIDESELKFSDGDEILLPSAGEDPLDIGSASALTIKDVAIGRTINVLKPKESGVYEQTFASYYINQKLRKKISTLARGASISNVYNSDLKKLEIHLPSLPEQTKIAKFLSALDRKIESVANQIAHTQAFKKGLLQQMFV